MHALKTIVIGLGVVLVVGFGLLIYGLTQNWHRVAGTAAVRPAAANAANWGDVALRQGASARLRAVTAAGNHVVLHVEEGDGARARLIVVDPASGSLVGTFWLTETP